MLGWIASARAGESAEPAETPPGSRSGVRRALREFDRFLDHHPLLEGQLRLGPGLTASPAFLDENPELRDFLRANPRILEGLKIYPRYFLNRALLRQACVPVSFVELAAFKELFRQYPALELELGRDPESIRNPGFLNARPPLRDFLVQHPVLGRAFLPSSPLTQSP